MARLRFATELYVVAATVATTGMASAAWIDPAVTSKLTPQLVQQIADAAENEELPVLVRINRDYPLEALRALPVGQRIARIRAIAQDSQAPLLEELENRSIGAIVDQPFWIANIIYLHATPAAIEEIAGRADVRWIEDDGKVQLIDGGPAPAQIQQAAGDRASGNGVEWNIQKINAPTAWQNGFTGAGMVIGHTDTGVDPNHPALAGHWNGQWLDTVNGRSTPYDDHGHGTHTLGIACGGDGLGPFGNDIGVAPGAKFVTAKVLDSGGSGYDHQIIQGLEFIGGLKPEVDVRVCSNSWGSTDRTSTSFWDVFATYLTIDILPVCANGNEGPGTGSAGTPGNYSVVLGVGSTNSRDLISSWSSRGPAPNRNPWNDPSTWFRPDWNLIKPDLSAPGENVRSCLPNNRYDTWSGTSMATPHMAGAVALLCEKNPTLTPDLLYDILLDSSVQPPAGDPYPNNDYGWGRLDVWSALESTAPLNAPWVRVVQTQLDDSPPGGNGDGKLDAGESASVLVELKNIGGQTAYNTRIVADSHDNYLTVDAALSDYGDLAPEESGNNLDSPIRIWAHDLTPGGHSVELGLAVHADGDSVDFDQVVPLRFTVGSPPPPVLLHLDQLEYADPDSFDLLWNTEQNWDLSTQSSHSPTHAMFSGGPTNSWEYVTLRDPIDLSGFNTATLAFWHAYNLQEELFTDMRVDVSVDNGATWKRGWVFDWMSDPLYRPWSPQEIELPNVGDGALRVRFGITADRFFVNWAKWWVDDLKVTTPDDIEPPYFVDAIEIPSGPARGSYTVGAQLADDYGIGWASVFYRVDGGAWQEVALTPIGNDWVSGQIPGQPAGSLVEYYYRAEDMWQEPNAGSHPVGAPDYGVFSFNVTERHVIEAPLP